MSSSTSTSTSTTLFIILITSVSSATTTTSNRRVLHQPFFPLTSTPPSPPPPPPPDEQQPFFQSYPSPPPPLQTPSPFASFPANITSLNIPHSSPNPVSHKLVALAVSLSLSAALMAGIALFFYFRGRNSRRGSKFDEKTASVNISTPPAPHPPNLRNPGQNSSEFLYLGTLASSASIDGAGPGVHGARGISRPPKLDSPELHPLPPLLGRQQRRSGGGDEDHDEFYSPRGSVCGSDSRRVFVTLVEAEKLAVDNNGGNSDDATSFSSSSGSVSPARSASISISPPIRASPKNRLSNSNPKSSPELIELQFHTQFRPNSASPEMLFTPPYSPSSGTEKDAETAMEEEEESPLLSVASSSGRMTLSPPESPRLSPLSGRIEKPSDDEREFRVSIPSQKSSFSSLKLPAFLGRGERKSSPELTSVSNSPVSSHYHSSPISSSGSSIRNSRRPSSAAAAAPTPPPPPPPPPLAFRRSRSPQLPPVSKPRGVAMPLKPLLVEKEVEVAVCARRTESEETTPKPKLKPLHWDKVLASSDRETVWDQLRSSSFKLNEEMIETLFVVNNHNNPSKKETTRNLVSPLAKQENRVLDPKKAQNIAILLRALNVTMDEVCEALIEGNAETLGTELLESLLKMAPTKEEERKLKEYKDDSPVKLGHAEKFLKAVIDIPYAFKRVEAMLYIANFESEVEYLKKSFETLEVACEELRSSRMFLKLLEAVLKTGNRMNVGTNRGDAQAFKLDTLLKLVDIKGADGKTTLLHFVVQEIIRTEGQRLSSANNQPSNDETECRKLGLQVVSSLSSEIANVKKAASMDSDVLSNDVSKLSSGLRNIMQVVKLIGQVHLHENNRRFSESMGKFIKMAEEDICRVQAQERVAISLVKEITEYFHGNSAKEEAHPFRIFMVVRDLLTVLDRVCKEVGMINERTTMDLARRFPVPVNPMLPVPVNPLRPQVLPGFPSRRQSSFSDDGSL